MRTLKHTSYWARIWNAECGMQNAECETGNAVCEFPLILTDENRKLFFSDDDYSKLKIRPTPLLMDYSPSYISLGNKLLVYKPDKETEDKIKSSEPDMVILANAHQLITHPKKFCEIYTKLRMISYPLPLYLPAVCAPNRIPVLLYIGVDVLDDLFIRLSASQDVIITPEGLFTKSDNAAETMHELLLHEMELCKKSIEENTLRFLVEQRIRTEPLLVEILRELDLRYYDFQISRCPVVVGRGSWESAQRSGVRGQNTGFIRAYSKESLYIPEIVRFRKKIIENYVAPQSTVVLLLPCSARKPYSSSKSHRVFKEILFSVQNHFAVHEIIITSPIGIVPRELEYTYPAAHYDVPVTGDWDKIELDIVYTMFEHYLKKNRACQYIINHTNIDFTSMNTTAEIYTTEESNTKLKEILKNICESTAPLSLKEKIKHDMLGIATFQFNTELGRELIENAKFRGRYPFIQIYRAGNHEPPTDKPLATFVPERGQFSLTIKGAELLEKHKMNRVFIDDFEIKGDIFTPGILQVDSAIHVGDEVAIIQKEKVVACGYAKMCTLDMLSYKRGVAVKVREVVE